MDDVRFIEEKLSRQQEIPILGFTDPDIIDTAKVFMLRNGKKGISFKLNMNDDEDAIAPKEKLCMAIEKGSGGIDYLCNWLCAITVGQTLTVSGNGVQEIPRGPFGLRKHDLFFYDIVFIRDTTGERLALPLYTGKEKKHNSRIIH